MRRLAQKLSIVFTAGAVGALLNSLAVWLFGLLGVTAALGVGIAPVMSAPWLYKRIVWGGLWGALFLLPILKGSVWRRGLLFSLCPTIVQLLVVFPFNTDKGMMGLGLGALTPVFVIFFNLVWGICAAWWVCKASELPGAGILRHPE